MSATDRPRVTVIIPAYRAAAALPRIVDQVVAQTEPPFEILLVCDGAIDETPVVAAELAAHHASVVSVPLPDNVGVARAREAGARRARGDYILFIDADDSIPATAVRTLVDAAVASGADVVVGEAVALLPDGRVDFTIAAPTGLGTLPSSEAFRLLLSGVVTGHLWNKLIRRSVVDECLPFAVSEVHSDLSIVTRAVSRAATVCFVAETVYVYHATPGSILKSGRRRGASLDVVAGVVRECADHVGPDVVASADYRSFVLTHITLSRLKDAVLGPYADEEADRLARAGVRELRWRDLPLAVRRGDLRSAAMLGAAKLSLPLYRRVMTRGRDVTGSRSHRMMDIVAREPA